MTFRKFLDKKWAVRITNNTADKIILWLAILGTLVAVAGATLMSSALFRHLNFGGSLQDEVFFLLLSCVGVYSLARFLVTRK